MQLGFDHHISQLEDSEYTSMWYYTFFFHFVEDILGDHECRR